MFVPEYQVFEIGRDLGILFGAQKMYAQLAPQVSKCHYLLHIKLSMLAQKPIEKAALAY